MAITERALHQSHLYEIRDENEADRFGMVVDSLVADSYELDAPPDIVVERVGEAAIALALGSEADSDQ